MQQQRRPKIQRWMQPIQEPMRGGKLPTRRWQAWCRSSVCDCVKRQPKVWNYMQIGDGIRDEIRILSTYPLRHFMRRRRGKRKRHMQQQQYRFNVQGYRYLYCGSPVLEEKTYLSHKLTVHSTTRQATVTVATASTSASSAACRSFSAPTVSPATVRHATRPTALPAAVAAAPCFEVRSRYVRSIGVRNLELLPQRVQAHGHPSGHFSPCFTLGRPRPRCCQAVEVVVVDVSVAASLSSSSLPIQAPNATATAAAITSGVRVGSLSTRRAVGLSAGSRLRRLRRS